MLEEWVEGEDVTGDWDGGNLFTLYLRNEYCE